jgi:hypothetical protein
MQIDFSQVILNIYTQGWFFWIGFLIIGFLLLKFSSRLGLSRREIRKMENSGASLLALGIIIHLLSAVALISV